MEWFQYPFSGSLIYSLALIIFGSNFFSINISTLNIYWTHWSRFRNVWFGAKRWDQWGVGGGYLGRVGLGLQRNFFTRNLTRQTVRIKAKKQMITMTAISASLKTGSWGLSPQLWGEGNIYNYEVRETQLWGERNTYIACHLPVVPIQVRRTFALPDDGGVVPVEPGRVRGELQLIGFALRRCL